MSFTKYLNPVKYKRYISKRMDNFIEHKKHTAVLRSLKNSEYDVRLSKEILKEILNDDVPAEMLVNLKIRKDVLDRLKLQFNLKDKMCTIPFRNAYITNPRGDMLICCSSRVYDNRSYVGKISEKPIEELFNCERASQFRDYIRNRTFNYCRSTCYDIHDLPLITDKEDHSSRNPYLGSNQDTRYFPEFLELAHDPTCNLMCPQCRTHRSGIPNAEKRVIEITQRNILEYLKTNGQYLQWLLMAGNGEVFASKYYIQILKELDCKKTHRNLNIGIRTNGNLLTPKKWMSLPHLHKNIKWIEISLDAASKETYMVVRRGGNWEKLNENLNYLAKESQVKDFQIRLNFVIQNRNFQEMGNFVDLAKTWNAKEVYFQTLYPRGEIRGEAFMNNNILNSDHPSHDRFLEILKTDNRLNDPICEFTSYVSQFKNEAKIPHFTPNAKTNKLASEN